MASRSTARNVPAAYRTDQEIEDLLEQIAAAPYGADPVSRRHVLDILDDLAEEMIGRRAHGDPEIRAEIQARSEKLRESIRTSER